MAISDEPRNDQPRRSSEDVLVTDAQHWRQGPPHALFAQLRDQCPVHWTSHIAQAPQESGYWSVLRPDDIRAVSRDWRTYSSERGGVTLMTDVFPLELVQAMFIGMDPPRHDRLRTSSRPGSRRGGSPLTSRPSAASPQRAGVADAHERRPPSPMSRSRSSRG